MVCTLSLLCLLLVRKKLLIIYTSDNQSTTLKTLTKFHILCPLKILSKQMLSTALPKGPAMSAYFKQIRVIQFTEINLHGQINLGL